jgi:sugar lactone lactonase YvrE
LASIKADFACRCPHLSSPKPLHVEFGQPWGATVDKDGNIYVADWNNHRVQRLSPESKFLMKFGEMERSRSLRTPMG